jgi:hypothetical protein
VTELNKSPRLSAKQQAQWVAKLQQLEFREPDLASELLGDGLWIAYAVFALVWLNSVARRQKSRWIIAVRERLVVPIATRLRVRDFAWVKGLRPRPPIFSEPESVRA